MKKFIFGIFATVLLSTFAFAINPIVNEISIEKQSKKEVQQIKEVSTTWTIGRKSRNCHRIGICKLEKVKITIAEGDVPDNGGDYYCKVSNNGSGQLKLVVDSNNMEIIKKGFGGEYLILEEDFTIEDADLLKELGLESYTIKTGTYDFQYDKETSKYSLVL